MYEVRTRERLNQQLLIYGYEVRPEQIEEMLGRVTTAQQSFNYKNVWRMSPKTETYCAAARGLKRAHCC